MKKKPVLILLSLATSLCSYAAVLPHIGYVYPAGGNPGETLSVTVGGQYLQSAETLYISGMTVEARNAGYTYEMDQKAGNNLRNSKEKIEAAMTNDIDELTRTQLQYQLDQIAGEMDMMMMARREMKKNPGVAKKKQFNPQIAERVQFEITLPADATYGTHELRLIATNGISNPILFHVGSLPEVQEVEPNNTVKEPVLVQELPAVVNGQIMPGDVDSFRIPAQEGQTLVFRANARALVPYLADAVPGWFQAVLTLYDAEGREVACADDFYFNPDPVLIYRVPDDGDYILQINDSIYRGREDFVYRIEMGELPFIDHIFPLGGPEIGETIVQLYGVNLSATRITLTPNAHAPTTLPVFTERFGLRSNTRLFAVDSLPESLETEPNDLPSQAQGVNEPLIINGRIDTSGDFDCFRFEGRRGQNVSLEVAARRLGSPLDARLVLLDAGEHIIASSDDMDDKSEGLETHHADACITTSLPETGLYTLRIDDLQGKGGEAYAYRLRIGGEQPDFCLRMTPSSLRIPQEGSDVVTVHVLRKGGFDGPVNLELIDAPRGLSLDRTVIPADASQAQITISTSGRAERELLPLEIEGTADVNLRTVTRRAVPAEDMMQAFLYRHLVPAEQLLVMVADPEPVTVTLDLPRSGTIEVRPGETFSLPATVSYGKDVKGYVQLELSDPPEWLTLKSKGVGGARPQPIQFDVSSNAEVGETATLLLNGKISITKPETDPTYNPVLKWKNRETVIFTIAAIPVKITD